LVVLDVLLSPGLKISGAIFIAEFPVVSRRVVLRELLLRFVDLSLLSIDPLLQ
jgi:hypothetical protein